MGEIGGRILRDEQARDGSGKAFIIALEYPLQRDAFGIAAPPRPETAPVEEPPKPETPPVAAPLVDETAKPEDAAKPDDAPPPADAPKSEEKPADPPKADEAPATAPQPEETPKPEDAPVDASEDKRIAALAEIAVKTREATPPQEAPVADAPVAVEPEPAAAPLPVAAPAAPAEAPLEAPVEAPKAVEPPPAEPVPVVVAPPLPAPQSGQEVLCKIGGDGVLVGVIPAGGAPVSGFDHKGMVVRDGDRRLVIVPFAPLTGALWQSETTPVVGMALDCAFDGHGKLATCKAQAVVRRGVVHDVDLAKDAFVVHVLTTSKTESNWRFGSALAAAGRPADFAERVCTLSQQWKGSCPPEPGMTVDCEFSGDDLIGVRQGPKYWPGMPSGEREPRRGNLIAGDGGFLVSVEDDVYCGSNALKAGDGIFCTYEYGRVVACKVPDYERDEKANAVVQRHSRHGTHIARRYPFDQKRLWKSNDVTPQLDMLVSCEFDQENNLTAVRPVAGLWRGLLKDGMRQGRIRRMPKGKSLIDIIPFKELAASILALAGFHALERFLADEARGRVSAEIEFGAEEWKEEDEPDDRRPVKCEFNARGRLISVYQDSYDKWPEKKLITGTIRRTISREGVVSVQFPFNENQWKGGKRSSFWRREVYSEFDDQGQLVAVRPMTGGGWTFWGVTRFIGTLGAWIFTINELVGNLVRALDWSEKLRNFVAQLPFAAFFARVWNTVTWPFRKIWEGLTFIFHYIYYVLLTRLFCWLDPKHADPGVLYKTLVLVTVVAIPLAAALSPWHEKARKRSAIRVGVLTLALVLLHALYWSGWIVNRHDRTPECAKSECGLNLPPETKNPGGGGPGPIGEGGGGSGAASQPAIFYFAYKSSAWVAATPADQGKTNKDWLEKLASDLNKKPASKVIITGHTDAKGSGEFNFDLSLCRAQQVRDRLNKDYGISLSRIALQATAFTVLKVQSDPNDLQNRRVVAVVVDNSDVPTNNQTMPNVECGPFESPAP